jgi:hypothetical protein
MIRAAAGDLDAAADRLEAAITVSVPLTHVIPSGIDEVSTAVADHLNKGAQSHDPAARQGVLEMRHAAQTLRDQAQQYSQNDADHAAKLKNAGQA